MKKILASIIAVVIMAPLAAQAKNWYGTINGGVAVLSDADATISDLGGSLSGKVDFDTGYLVNGGAGYDFGNIRAEGLIHYQTNDIDSLSYMGISMPVTDSDISSLAFMLNGYYDFDTGTALKPFVTAGLGYDRVTLDEPDGDSNDSVFAWQIGVGAGYAFNEHVSLDLTYRYFATSDPSFDIADGSTAKIEIGSHNISLGLRYNF